MAINPSLLIIPDRFKAAKLYSQLPESGDGDFLVTRSTTATRVNASGLIESVASGVPRLDYTGGGCPSLLVEPAATNLFLRSDNLANAAWGKFTSGAGSIPTVVTDDGTINGLLSDKVTFTPSGITSSDTSRISQSISIPAVGNYTQSYLIKSLSGTQQLRMIFAASAQDITIGETPVLITFTANLNVLTSWTTGLVQIGTHTRTTGEFLIAYAQMEQGSVATSYIPTVASTVTRNADVISLSSASGLIGQSEGYLYAEVDLKNVIQRTRGILEIRTSGTQTIALLCFSNGNLGGYIINSGDQFVRSITTVAGRYKLALAYSAASTVLYINGQIVGAASASVSVPPSNDIQLGNYGGAINQLTDRISAVAIGTTRPSNDELAAMTTL